MWVDHFWLMNYEAPTERSGFIFNVPAFFFSPTFKVSDLETFQQIIALSPTHSLVQTTILTEKLLDYVDQIEIMFSTTLHAEQAQIINSIASISDLQATLYAASYIVGNIRQNLRTVDDEVIKESILISRLHKQKLRITQVSDILHRMAEIEEVIKEMDSFIASQQHLRAISLSEDILDDLDVAGPHSIWKRSITKQIRAKLSAIRGSVSKELLSVFTTPGCDGVTQVPNIIFPPYAMSHPSFLEYISLPINQIAFHHNQELTTSTLTSSLQVLQTSLTNPRLHRPEEIISAVLSVLSIMTTSREHDPTPEEESESVRFSAVIPLSVCNHIPLPSINTLLVPALKIGHASDFEEYQTILTNQHATDIKSLLTSFFDNHDVPSITFGSDSSSGLLHPQPIRKVQAKTKSQKPKAKKAPKPKLVVQTREQNIESRFGLSQTRPTPRQDKESDSSFQNFRGAFKKLRNEVKSTLSSSSSTSIKDKVDSKPSRLSINPISTRPTHLNPFTTTPVQQTPIRPPIKPAITPKPTSPSHDRTVFAQPRPPSVSHTSPPPQSPRNNTSTPPLQSMTPILPSSSPFVAPRSPSPTLPTLHSNHSSVVQPFTTPSLASALSSLSHQQFISFFRVVAAHATNRHAFTGITLQLVNSSIEELLWRTVVKLKFRPKARAHSTQTDEELSVEILNHQLHNMLPILETLSAARHEATFISTLILSLFVKHRKTYFTQTFSSIASSLSADLASSDPERQAYDRFWRREVTKLEDGLRETVHVCLLWVSHTDAIISQGDRIISQRKIEQDIVQANLAISKSSLIDSELKSFFVSSCHLIQNCIQSYTRVTPQTYSRHYDLFHYMFLSLSSLIGSFVTSLALHHQAILNHSIDTDTWNCEEMIGEGVQDIFDEMSGPMHIGPEMTLSDSEWFIVKHEEIQEEEEDDAPFLEEKEEDDVEDEILTQSEVSSVQSQMPDFLNTVQINGVSFRLFHWMETLTQSISENLELAASLAILSNSVNHSFHSLLVPISSIPSPFPTEPFLHYLAEPVEALLEQSLKLIKDVNASTFQLINKANLFTQRNVRISTRHIAAMHQHLNILQFFLSQIKQMAESINSTRTFIKTAQLNQTSQSLQKSIQFHQDELESRIVKIGTDATKHELRKLKLTPPAHHHSPAEMVPLPDEFVKATGKLNELSRTLSQYVPKQSKELLMTRTVNSVIVAIKELFSTQLSSSDDPESLSSFISSFLPLLAENLALHTTVSADAIVERLSPIRAQQSISPANI
ncbi:Vps54, component of GARP (Golgi-associated retrograde protein) complex [Blattamonas nauphoetae]|uniref:Vps54, component of GARP (Golgi-associated retrograde protein) complex n=1 Tax=Blattamonas nauphoetae TaxID=2049346 RepID=A0ABQ9YKB7_9EUKA|nr:Vps54, component of GARP (Golgi-associated retrograde protein) complex [Blattamonas nauphoetae]